MSIYTSIYISIYISICAQASERQAEQQAAHDALAKMAASDQKKLADRELQAAEETAARQRDMVDRALEAAEAEAAKRKQWAEQGVAVAKASIESLPSKKRLTQRRPAAPPADSEWTTGFEQGGVQQQQQQQEQQQQQQQPPPVGAEATSGGASSGVVAGEAASAAAGALSGMAHGVGARAEGGADAPFIPAAVTAKAMASIEAAPEPIPAAHLAYRVAVFTTNPRVDQSLSTLSLLRRTNLAYANWDYFLLSSADFGPAVTAMALATKVKLLHVEPQEGASAPHGVGAPGKSAFNASEAWKYDWIYGPEQFHKLGYDLSLFVDGEAIVALRQFELSGVLSRVAKSPIAAVDFANWPTPRGNFNLGVLWFNNTIAHSQGLSSRFVDAYRLVPRWPANGAHLLFDAMWSNASAETFARTAIPPAQLAKLRRVNISSLAPSWNTDCHGVDCHDVDCRAPMKSGPRVALPARKFVYDNGAFMFHFTKYNDGYCTSSPSDSQQPKFFDAIHEKAWRLGSDHYRARQSMWKMQKDAQAVSTAFPAAQHRSPP